MSNNQPKRKKDMPNALIVRNTQKLRGFLSFIVGCFPTTRTVRGWRNDQPTINLTRGDFIMKSNSRSSFERSAAVVALCASFMFIGTLPALAKNRVNLNTASESQLASVDGISPELAKLIVKYRKHKGNVIVSVHEIKDLMEQAELNHIAKSVTVGKLTEAQLLGEDELQLTEQ